MPNRPLDSLFAQMPAGGPATSLPTGGDPAPDAERIGPYVIGAYLGEGGMGEVWAATDTRSGRRVAIKFPSDEIAGDSRGRRRFLGEAEVLAQLGHRGIVRVLDTGEHEGIPFLVMEVIEGCSFGRIASFARAHRLEPVRVDGRGVRAQQ